MSPTDLSSVETVRTVVHAHLVVDPIQGELSFGNSICISTMDSVMSNYLPTVEP